MDILKKKLNAATKVKHSTNTSSESYKYPTNLQKERMEEAKKIIELQNDLERKKKLELYRKAEKILPQEENSEQIVLKVNKQVKDNWSTIVTQIQRQLESTKDLRVDIASPEVYEPREEDTSTVKFFKGIFNEWRIRMNSLTDEELLERKEELSRMWFTLFALQPLFNGLNKHNLSKELTIHTQKIADALRSTDFTRAKECYNNLAIGNMIWPMGITQYSVHWKFSMDLMASERVLHIFNSEAGRNAVLSIKRLMNKYEEFHQTKIE